MNIQLLMSKDYKICAINKKNKLRKINNIIINYK